MGSGVSLNVGGFLSPRRTNSKQDSSEDTISNRIRNNNIFQAGSDDYEDVDIDELLNRGGNVSVGSMNSETEYLLKEALLGLFLNDDSELKMVRKYIILLISLYLSWFIVLYFIYRFFKNVIFNSKRICF